MKNKLRHSAFGMRLSAQAADRKPKALTNFHNNKAQFFIASAVIIILSIYVIFFYLSTVSYAPDTQIKESDPSFFVVNIKDEFGKVAEIALSNVSGYLGQSPITPNPTNAFDANLSNFSSEARNYALQRGIILNVRHTVLEASNTTMNASIDVNFSTLNTFINTTFYAYRRILVDALNGSLITQLPTGCSLNVTVRREYNESITNLSKTHFTFLINDSTGTLVQCASPIYSEGSPGKYNFTCESSSCASSKVVANVTDLRNIIAWSTLPNTGLGRGCAADCGQALD